MEKEALINIHRVSDDSLAQFIQSYEIEFKRKWKLLSVSPSLVKDGKTVQWLVLFLNSEFTA